MEEYDFLLASPCHFIGSSISENISIEHVFENFLNYEKSYQIGENSYHLVRFKMPEHKKAPGVAVPNYYPVGEIISQLCTVFFGKLVIPLGFIRANDMFCVPDNVDLSKYDKRLPFYSSEQRFEFPVAFNRGILSNISLDKLDQNFLDASKVYQNALMDFPRDTSIAYMSLVGAGEILTKDIIFKDEELYEKEILDFFDEVNEALGKKKLNLVKSRMRQIKKRYYMGMERFFDSRLVSTNEQVHRKLTKDNIEDTLKAAYDLRSKFLHEGFRMGMHTTHNIFEVGLTHSRGYSQNLINLLNRAPTFVTLERIVRFALLKRLFELHESELTIPSEKSPFNFA